MPHQLNDRQHRILIHTANGLTLQEIATREHLSRETVSRTRAATTRLLSARDRTHAVAIALTTGTLQPTDIRP